MFVSGSTASGVRSVLVGPVRPLAVRSHSQRPATSMSSAARGTTTAITARRLRGAGAATANDVGPASDWVAKVVGAAVSRARTAASNALVSAAVSAPDAASSPLPQPFHARNDPAPAHLYDTPANN